MFAPESLILGETVSNGKVDLRKAEKIEQYRLGNEAVYIPAGLKWNYIPISRIQQASPSHRTVSAGHCVTVEVKTPALEIITSSGSFELHFEKQESLERILNALNV